MGADEEILFNRFEASTALEILVLLESFLGLNVELSFDDVLA